MLMTRFYLVGSEHPVAYPDSNEAAVKHGRPVVVIDPEDREQVERLLSALAIEFATDFGTQPGDVEAAQAALRQFANPQPPKPVEPTGLGAVVEDAQGRRWTRYRETTTVRHWHPADGAGDERRYDQVAVVRILNHGWQPDDEAAQS